MTIPELESEPLSGYTAGSQVAMTAPGIWFLADRSDFALVQYGADETRVAIRGRFRVELRYSQDAVTIVQAAHDEEVTQRSFGGMPLALRLLAVGGADDGADPATDSVMPLECGVVSASVVGFGLDSFVRPPEPETDEMPAVDPVGAAETEIEINLDAFLLRRVADVGDMPDAGASGSLPDSGDAAEYEPLVAEEAVVVETSVVPVVAPAPEPVPVARAEAPGTGLALDDLSWMGGGAVAAQAVLPTPEVVVPAQETTPPVQHSGLALDAEATTFRPGRAPVHVGGTNQSIVLAVLCPSGHVNPPRSPVCRVCRQPVEPAQQPRPVTRPALGRLRLSNGEVYVLDRGFLLGRNPTPRSAASGPAPNVLRLPSRDGDVSRNHAEIRLEGWQVIVADLGSTNGTYLSGPGITPRVLSGGEEQVVEPGCVVTLAHDVWITYEVDA